MKRTLLAAALLFTSVFGIAGCGSDDDVPPAESRIKNFCSAHSCKSSFKPAPFASDEIFDDIIEDDIDIHRSLDDIDDDFLSDFLDRDAKLDLMRDHIRKYVSPSESSNFKNPSYDLRQEPEPPVDPSITPFNSSSVTFDEEGNLIRE